MLNKEQRMMAKALLVMLLWGTLFPLVKLGFRTYSVITTGDILLFAGIRFTVCGLLISGWTFVRQRSAFIQARQSVASVLLVGLFAIILHYSFTYLGLNITEGSKTAILKQLGALFYVCFSALFVKEDRLTTAKLAGVLLGFAGIVVINADSNGVHINVGDVLIIAASFCTVFSNVIGKKLFKTVDPIAATGLSQLFGGVVLLIVGFMLGGSVDMGHSLWIMICICVASVISYCLWYGTVKQGELSKLFIIKFAEPVFAAVFGAVLLGENIWKWQYLAAFILITAGIGVSNRKIKKG